MDPLFGAGIRFDGDAPKAEAGLGFLAMARRLPRLVAVVLRLAWAADRWALTAVLAIQIAVAPLTLTGLLATNRVLEPLLAGGPTPERVLGALPALAWLGTATALVSVLTAVGNAARTALAPKVQRAADTRLMHCAVRVELAAAEDSRFHDLMASGYRGAEATAKVIDSVVGVIGAVLGLLAAAGALAVLSPWLVPLLVLAVVPKGWATVRSARARFVSARKHTELVRQVDLLGSLTVFPQAAEELRTHKVGDFLLGHHARLSARAEAENQRLAWAESRANLVAGAISGLTVAVVYGVLVLLLLRGDVPLATTGAALLAISLGLTRLTMLVSQVNVVYEKGLFVLDWENALAEADRHRMRVDGRPVPGPPSVITATDVHFRYPGAPRPAVDGATVSVRRGEIIALVGENGSGKTTMAKLLAGLYLPESGAITWDGADLAGLNRDDVFDQVALVSQNFMNWPFAARVNVGIGRTDREATAELLEDAARAGGADRIVARLPHGWDTLLAREFLGGTNLSGGQWQRIGLARAWFRDASVLIFDEPTAALDPVTEIEVFDRVAKLAKAGKSVILVTHRMASVRCADRIYVLDAGVVTESGTHDELMAAGGRYAAMYKVQAEQFA
ncbi:multidrug ABC transporter permease [Lentzea sp. NBRC 105346]|uniref:ABC transporter ATP-binding protein n=1 Tax=Lentzea sp. NBRC 105346 TaxID=3032205 RepID=UPI0024A5F1ED|nr:ABC transporter ATP-binding protein [Lentzea sp. NBRC 105346]GLZ35619.1 multidrug ABC transporter permease [Lentzea sp. NBRC 105346]